ncbi:hypothetical protein A2U01_0040449, partial [Trifolium medium]|nr:hypothetical protein [Trifolium medium]
ELDPSSVTTHRHRTLAAGSVKRSAAGISLADGIQSIAAIVSIAAISCRRISPSSSFTG